MKTHHCVSMVPLFNHLSGEDQEQIDRLVSHRHFHKGETIWQPGNDPLLIIAESLHDFLQWTGAASPYPQPGRL